ncbi:MAG: DsbA family oxidoreductase [Lachnospiraceae bacterium]|nr:DsbA family oxidoreductase [Lachnospiraceae bacterium]
MKITYWADYACPYCYIGEARLKKAIASIPELKDVEIEMKAFQLDSSAGKHAKSDTQTRFAHKYGISFADAGRQIASISQMGIAEGLDFKYATTLFTNTMDAHRLTKLAQSKEYPDLAYRVIEALFKAYFTDNKELADKDLLQQIGEENGLDAAEVREVLESDKYRDEVIMDEREAARYGIHAVPFFVIGRYGISGAQSVEGMKATILKVLEESKETVTE